MAPLRETGVLRPFHPGTNFCKCYECFLRNVQTFSIQINFRRRRTSTTSMCRPFSKRSRRSTCFLTRKNERKQRRRSLKPLRQTVNKCAVNYMAPTLVYKFSVFWGCLTLINFHCELSLVHVKKSSRKMSHNLYGILRRASSLRSDNTTRVLRNLFVANFGNFSNSPPSFDVLMPSVPITNNPFTEGTRTIDPSLDF